MERSLPAGLVCQNRKAGEGTELLDLPGGRCYLGVFSHDSGPEGPMYDELHRPQFHLTPGAHWMNDPNGQFCYKGEYHHFFQHSPGFVYHAPN